MGKFDGKKLLVLGTNVGSVDIVNYARSEGAYVYVADYLPVEKSDAKQVADEAVDISTIDTEKLIEFAKKNKIDGVFSGVSEVNIESARKVNEAINNEYYYTEDQWQRFMTKSSFKELCEKYDIPTPKTYYKGKVNYALIEKLEIKYPVIVKPVDNCANFGISVCDDKDQLNKAVEFAEKNSFKKEVIIEQFIRGTEISFTYVVQDGICKLVYCWDKYAYENENKLTALSHAMVSPSSYHDLFIQKVGKKVQNMILGEGLNNCTIFIQGIYNSGEFYMFEAGLRMGGAANYRKTFAINGQNFMHFLVDCILKVKTDYDITKEDATLGGKKCVTFSHISDGGKIARIEGLSIIENDPMIISFEQRYKIGDVVARDGTLRQITLRYVLIDKDMNKIVEKIKLIQRNVKVFDPTGKNILINEFDPSILLGG